MADDDEDKNLPPQEAFFRAAKKGDVAILNTYLDARVELGVDINARDEGGYTALNRSISEGYLVTIYPLLEAGAKVNDAMLRAVDADFHEAVRVLLEYADEKCEAERLAIVNCHCETNDMHPDVTPIIRAAQLNSYAIVKMLLEADMIIPEISASDIQTTSADEFQRSVGILEIYGGLASEAYVCLASTDPIERAFSLCASMRAISIIEVEFKVRYEELANKMEQLAADLVSYARDSEEITTVLTYCEDGNAPGTTDSTRHSELLPKLTRAIQLQQRRFVAHPNCQQSVSAQFYRHLSHLRDRPPVINMLVFVALMLAYPFLSILYKLGVSVKVRKLVRTPYVKLVSSIASDLTLIILLLLVNAYPDDREDPHFYRRGAIYGSILLFAIGLAWREMYLVYVKGPRKIMTSFPHVRDMIVAVLLTAFCILSVYSYLAPSACPSTLSRSARHATNETLPEYQTVITDFTTNMIELAQERLDEMQLSLTAQAQFTLDDLVSDVIEKLRCVESVASPSVDMPQGTPPSPSPTTACAVNDLYHRSGNDPGLIANGLFAIAIVIAFTRILSFLVALDFVGALVISVADMIRQTSVFFTFVIAVIAAFSASMTFMYSYYSDVAKRKACDQNSGSDACGNDHYKFSNLGQSMLSLYWSLFGLIDKKDLRVAGMPEIMESAGTILYGLFYIFAVLVLLNALIAVMSNVFNKVEENVDVEWKFSRTALWMSFLDDTFTAPPPFNLLPNLQETKRHLMKMWYKCCHKTRLPRKFKNADSNGMEMDDVKGIASRHRTYKRVELGNYQRIMTKLVERYIADRTSQEASAAGDITVADLRNLRNDIVALRYDTFKRLCKVNEELDVTRGQSSTIHGQSNQASEVFDRTEKIDQEVGAYKSRLASVQSELETKLQILPAIEELIQMIQQMNTGSFQTALGKNVRDMVSFYEEIKDKIVENNAAAVAARRPSALVKIPGLTLTLENVDDEE